MTTTTEPCPTCGKPPAICICALCAPLEVRTRVVVLQHPQEQDVNLGTAPILERTVGATRKVGLSWPNLADALGGEPKGRWAVLYPSSLPRELTPQELAAPAAIVDRNGASVLVKLDGIILLDGTWSQAKALWWRNAWLLKLDRLIVRPREPSIYGKMRKEPRKEYVSTLEAAADALVANGEPESVRTELRRLMRTMVQRARDATPA